MHIERSSPHPCYVYLIIAISWVLSWNREAKLLVQLFDLGIPDAFQGTYAAHHFLSVFFQQSVHSFSVLTL